jgi:hypothetical protein
MVQDDKYLFPLFNSSCKDSKNQAFAFETGSLKRSLSEKRLYLLPAFGKKIHY